MSELRYERVPPADLGADTQSAPESVSPRHAPVVENFLVDHPGKLKLRGPLRHRSPLAAVSASTGYLAGAVPVRRFIGPDAVPDAVALPRYLTGKREPWVAPFRRTTTAADLVIASNGTSPAVCELFPLGEAGVTESTAITWGNARSAPGIYRADVGERNYWIGLSGDTTGAGDIITLSDGSHYAQTRLTRWNGSAVTTYVNAPRASLGLRFYAQRLFMLGGTPADGPTANLSFDTLYYSDLLASSTPDLADTAAAWSDDTTGLVNKIQVGASDSSDYGIGLATIDGGLVIFKRRSMHVLRGHSPSTFTVKQAASSVGCIDPRTIVEYEGGVFFCSDRGLEFFDGHEVRNHSGAVFTELSDALDEAVGDHGVDGGFAHVTRLSRDYLHVVVGTKERPGGGSNTVTFSKFYCTTSGGWSTFNANGTNSILPVLACRTPRYPAFVDSRAIYMSDELARPESAPDASRGKDVLTTSEAGATETVPIKPKWHSRLLRLGTPLNKAQLHRLLLDYKFQVDAGADDGSNGWYVTLVRGDGTTAVDEYQVPAQGDPGSYLYRRRHVQDAFGEVDDVQLRVEWKTTATALVAAELYEAGIEFQVARQRRSS